MAEELPPVSRSAAPDTPEERALPFVTNAWSRQVLQPLLIAGMSTALFTGAITVLQEAMPGLPWFYFVFLCVFASLEGVYTSLWLAHPDRLHINRFTYRVAELVFIAILTRFAAWALLGNWPGVAELRSYLINPLLLFDNTFFLVGLLVVVLAWQRAVAVGSTFNSLALDRAEALFYTTPLHMRQVGNRPLAYDRSRLIAGFFEQWIWGGIFLAITAALTTVRLSGASLDGPFAVTHVGLPPQMLLALLIYFLTGFLLLSQGRLAVMNARWLVDGVIKDRQVERTWHRYSLWLLLAVAFVASLLPLGSTVAIGRILEVALFIIFFAVNLILYLFSLVLFSLYSLFRSTPSEELEPPPSLAEFLAEAPAELPPPERAPSLLFGALFWIIVITVATMAIIFFLRDRGITINSQMVLEAWRAFTAWLRSLWRGVVTPVRHFGQAIRTRLRTQAPTGSQAAWRFVRVNALPPREQVRYFYLSTVRRAGERGVPRRESETPLEYAQDLKESWPEAEVDVETLTDAFVKARYTPQPIEAEEISPIKQRWKQLRGRLRQRARKK